MQQDELSAFPGVFASRLLWKEALDGTARELLAVADAVEDSEERSALNETAEWLKDLITAEHGELDKREIIALARANGFSERTVYRARDKLSIQVRTSGFGKDKRSLWKLPNPANPANAASHKSLAEMAEMADERAEIYI